MTFTAIDAFVEHGDPRVVLECDGCGERLEVFDTLDVERAQDIAHNQHQHDICCHCGEPIASGEALSDEPNAVPVHRSCYESDAPAARESIMSYLDAQQVA